MFRRWRRALPACQGERGTPRRASGARGRSLRARSDRDELLRRARGPRRRPGGRRRSERRHGRAAARARADGRLGRRDPRHTHALGSLRRRRRARGGNGRSRLRPGGRAGRADRTPSAFYANAPVPLHPAGRPSTRSRAGRRSTSRTIAFDVVHVPGHSPGHLAYHADGCLFSGDVLFAGSVGRTRPPVRRLGHADRIDPRRSSSAIPPETDRLLRPRPADDARRRGRDEPLPRGASVA